MSAAEEAYRAAEAAIAEAKRTGAETLSFDSDEFRALDHVPPVVGALESLRSLNLNNTKVSDLSPLAGMTGLGTLWLDSTLVSDLSPLARITRLGSLRLNNTQVSDLSPLTGLTALEWISLDHTQVSDLSPLTGLTALVWLRLDNTQVSDLSPLTGLTALEWISLDNTQVSDLSPLTGLTALEWISLCNTQISDLSPLAGVTGLGTLWLDITQVSDLSPLAGMTRLETLSLIITRVSDLSPLAGITGLRMLSLDKSPVWDLRPLRGLRKLADDPQYGGLAFKGIPATADPQIADIAVIADSEARAVALFALLDAGWVPPDQDRQTAIPEQVPAPIEAELTGEGVLVERLVPPGLTGDRDARARAGWAALRELQADALDTLCKDNLPSLRRAIHAFGRALGDDYGTMNVIALGTHGRRIVEMSKTVDEALLEDAAGDLNAFAAAIELHVQRFPEWIAYLRETEGAAPEGPPLELSLPQLRVIVSVLTEAEDVDPALARKFGDLLEGAEDAETVDAPAKLGVLRSLSNILAPLATQAMTGARKVGGDLFGEAYKTATKGVVVSGAGVGWDLIFNKGQVLLALAQSYPTTLGWLTQVLRALGVS